MATKITRRSVLKGASLLGAAAATGATIGRARADDRADAADQRACRFAEIAGELAG